MDGVTGLAESAELDSRSLSEMAHGRTIATNAILEGEGACTALLTTRGLREALELRRSRAPRVHEPLHVKPGPLRDRGVVLSMSPEGLHVDEPETRQRRENAPDKQQRQR